MNLWALSAVLPIEMTENETQDCPTCAEAVRDEASICPHCREPLKGRAAPDTFRNRPGRQIGGVAIALAEAVGISVTFVRLLFIVLTFVSFIGPVLYVGLWFLIPAQPGALSSLGRLVNGDEGEPSILERAATRSRNLFDKVAAWFRPNSAGDGEHPSEGAS